MSQFALLAPEVVQVHLSQQFIIFYQEQQR